MQTETQQHTEESLAGLTWGELYFVASDLANKITKAELHDKLLNAFPLKTGQECRACFKGEMTKEHFYILLKYIDDMKLRGWEFEKHDRKNGKNETLNIDYVLVKYGI